MGLAQELSMNTCENAQAASSEPSLRDHAHGPALETWLANDGARLLCDASGAVLWLNDAARDALEVSPVLVLRDGILTAMARGGGPALPELLHSPSERIAAYVIGEREDEIGTVVIVRTVEADGVSLRGITLRTIKGRSVFVWPDLTHIYRMTAAERRIAQEVVEGGTAEDLALRLGLSVQTVRTHIRHIYSKVGVSSREGLFARLMPYMVWDD